jgi:predicted metal-dependent hydrolase
VSYTTSDYTAAITALGLPAIVRLDVAEMSPRRKSVAMSVDLYGCITVAVPSGADPVEVAQAVHRRRMTLIRWAQQHEQYAPAHPVKELVCGEGFRWLGSNHRLRLVDEHDVPIGFDVAHRHQSWLLLRKDHATPETIIAWYQGMGTAYATSEVQRWIARCGITTAPAVEVTDLGPRRWSEYRRRTVRLHWAAFQMNREIIRYLVMRELTQSHNKGLAYGPLWRRRMDVRMGDWRDVERQLASAGARVWLGETVHDQSKEKGQ